MLTRIGTATVTGPNRPEGTVFLIAPNYEERSLGSIQTVCDIAARSQNTISVLLLKFQSGMSPVLLDKVKDDNYERALRMLADHPSVRVIKLAAHWPVSGESIGQLMWQIFEICADTGSSTALYLDISALPRSLLLGLLDRVLEGWTTTGLYLAAGATIVAVGFIYTPADRYPISHSDDVLGSVHGRYTGRRLDEFLTMSATTVDCVLSLAGTGHDAAQVLGSVPSVGTASCEFRPFLFFSHDQTSLSFAKIALNVWSLRELRRIASRVDYYFDVDHLSRSLYRDAVATAQRHLAMNGSRVYLLAGFGPKTVGLACYLAKRVYDRTVGSGKGGQSDVLLARSAQYSTVYSIGKRQPQIYQLDSQFVSDAPGLTDGEGG